MRTAAQKEANPSSRGSFGVEPPTLAGRVSDSSQHLAGMPLQQEPRFPLEGEVSFWQIWKIFD